jgi:hypothetical protein
MGGNTALPDGVPRLGDSVGLPLQLSGVGSPMATPIYSGKTEMQKYAEQFGAPGSREYQAALHEDFALLKRGLLLKSGVREDYFFSSL